MIFRTGDKAQNRPRWHYINLAFKPEGQPPSVQTREPEPITILTAMAENQRIMANETDADRKAIALAWLLHLVGTYTSPCTRRSSSQLTIPKATGAGMRSVSG
jgi:hypothetical protein